MIGDCRHTGQERHRATPAQSASAQASARLRRSGRGAAWLARLLGVQEVPGSNPGGPTKYLKELQTQDLSKPTVWSPTGVQNGRRGLSFAGLLAASRYILLQSQGSRARVLRLVERRSFRESVPSGYRPETSLRLSSWHVIEGANGSDEIAQAGYRQDSPLRRGGTGSACKLRARLLPAAGDGGLAVARSPSPEHSGKVHRTARRRSNRMEACGAETSQYEPKHLRSRSQEQANGPQHRAEPPVLISCASLVL